ncbi:hypothetical protein M1589_04615 [Candidatus Marsarchaeota archaeon]|jgi:hypothetical protein|nr:hypothetical protein [Candidatus Marsarchaeota archaeon]MCL5115396.1 hypothetical protein [Candidatus Marsarchaeota archaeon]
MRLEFVIDKGYDTKIALQLKQSGWNRLANVKVDHKSIAKKYANTLKVLKLTRKLYQSSWDEINDKFSGYVEKTTGYDWFYPKYFCVVSVITPGASNWGYRPRIVRNWMENPYWMRRITAHELILSHYFEIYRRHYSDEGLTNGQVWALAEIAAWALTSLTREVKEFWPWNTEYYTNHNYPHIVKLQLQLKAIFLKRKDFDGYIRKGIALVKKYPKMGPNGT